MNMTWWWSLIVLQRGIFLVAMTVCWTKPTILNVNRVITIVIAAHELTRGLGFTSSFTNYRDSKGAKYVGPSIFNNAGGPNFFKPLNAFDSLLHVGDKCLADVANPIVTLATTNDWPTNQSAKDAGYELYRLIIDSRLVAKVGHDILPLVLNSNENFTNVDLRADHRAPSSDFITTREVFKTTNSLVKEMSRLKMPVLYGPRNLQVLSEIGYIIRNSPLESNFDVSKTFGTAQYSPSEADFNDSELNGARLTSVFDQPLEVTPKYEFDSIENLEDSLSSDHFDFGDEIDSKRQRIE